MHFSPLYQDVTDTSHALVGNAFIEIKDGYFYSPFPGPVHRPKILFFRSSWKLYYADFPTIVDLMVSYFLFFRKKSFNLFRKKTRNKNGQYAGDNFTNGLEL